MFGSTNLVVPDAIAEAILNLETGASYHASVSKLGFISMSPVSPINFSCKAPPFVSIMKAVLSV